MKLKISELHSGFQGKLFEISVDKLPKRGTVFNDKMVRCELSVHKEPEGYKMTGLLKSIPTYECVRCLELNPVDLILPIQLTLYNNKRHLAEKNNVESLYFNDEREYIDLENIIADLIELAKPINPLCKTDCKGLCSVCGINKNNRSCSCKSKNKSMVWDKLKDFK
tara:strand:- start:552 stop:1049 length:498 start_codon:yes stop_codon:yes gene_type:complete